MNFEKLEPLIIEPSENPTATFLRIVTDHIEGGASGKGIGDFVEHNRQEYYARHHLQEIEPRLRGKWSRVWSARGRVHQCAAAPRRADSPDTSYSRTDCELSTACGRESGLRRSEQVRTSP